MKRFTKSLLVAVLLSSFITGCGGGSGDGDGDDTPDETIDTPQTQTDISKAKNLIKNSRTLVKQIEENFDSPIDALDADQQTIESVYESDIVDIADLLGQIVDQTLAYFDRTTTLRGQLDNPGSHDIPIVNDQGETIGTLNAVVSTDNGVTLTLNGYAKGATEVTANVTNLKITTNLNRSDIRLAKLGALKSGWTGAFTSDDVRLGVSGFVGNDSASLALEDVSLRITASEPITVGFEGKQVILPYLTSASFSGTVVLKANDATFTGKTEIKLVGLEKAKQTLPDTPLSIKYLALSGEFESPRGTFSTSVSLDIENAATFDTFGFMDYRRYEWHYVRYAGLGEVPFFREKTQDCAEAIGEGYSNSDLSYFGISGNKTSMRISCSVGGFRANLDDINLPTEIVNDLRDYLPADHQILNLAALNFSYYGYPSSGSSYGYLDYKIDRGAFETADNFAKGLLTVTASATVPGIPSVVATLTVKREELNGGNASLTVSHGDQTYTISISSNNIIADAESARFTITLSNPDGVQVTFISNGSEYGGDISVDGTNIGTIETAQNLPIVRYNDGTMETLF